MDKHVSGKDGPDMEGVFAVKVVRSGRKTFSLQVDANGGVTLRAPMRATQAEISRILRERHDWILRARAKAEKKRAEQPAVRRLTAEELAELGRQAAKAVPPIAEKYAARLGVTYGRITIRCQKTRWGSCSSKGNLNFNCLLMLAPAYVLESVVAHEICHRKHMDHSAAFYAELYGICPDYENGNKWLKQNGSMLQAAIGGGQQT
ncbi:MAG: SprT family zinc-dependent metalloprotease [Clostridia bacterium]|nr:SprT family zinc-dependent metalloprotease [Clostridia bacterium]